MVSENVRERACARAHGRSTRQRRVATTHGQVPQAHTTVTQRWRGELYRCARAQHVLTEALALCELHDFTIGIVEEHLGDAARHEESERGGRREAGTEVLRRGG